MEGFSVFVWVHVENTDPRLMSSVCNVGTEVAREPE
jgi:hypothetical protein